MFNPRFPHTLRVLRPRFDFSGVPVTDDEGNPIYDVVPLQLVVMMDNEPCRDADGKFITRFDTKVNFGYRTTTESTSTTNAVFVSSFRIDCPMFLTEIYADDILEMTDYERSYRARVVKKTTGNMGTTIWLDDIKN